MSNSLTTKTESAEVISKLVLSGDLSKMTDSQKVSYYRQFCESLGLNPLTEPFAILKLNGKEKLYAKKDATEQLRKVHGVSITSLITDIVAGCYKVTAEAKDASGKTDIATGVVPIDGLKGENLANAMMKAETKAKRRVTLSICGLGMLDESEIESIPNAVTVDAEEVWQPASEMWAEANTLLNNSTLDDVKKSAASAKLTEAKNLASWNKIINRLREVQIAS